MPDAAPKDQPDPHAVAPRGGGARLSALVVALVVLVGGGAAGLYGIATRSGKAAPHTGACAQSLDRAVAIDPLLHGEVAGLNAANRPEDLSAVTFDDDGGRRTSIAAFRDRTVLLNLWATWCVPCRAEMPALDRLQAALGSKDFSVVPVNVDTVRLDKPRTFLKEIGAKSLRFYSDRTADILQALKQTGPISGLPTSILIGKDGCAIATMAGPAAWDSNDAKAVISKASS